MIEILCLSRIGPYINKRDDVTKEWLLKSLHTLFNKLSFNMNTLILPVAGRSSRYGLSRPKWLLTMPSGELMFEYSISKLDFKNFSKILLVCLDEHLKFISADRI